MKRSNGFSLIGVIAGLAIAAAVAVIVTIGLKGVFTGQQRLFSKGESRANLTSVLNCFMDLRSSAQSCTVTYRDLTPAECTAKNMPAGCKETTEFRCVGDPNENATLTDDSDDITYVFTLDRNTNVLTASMQNNLGQVRSQQTFPDVLDFHVCNDLLMRDGVCGLFNEFLSSDHADRLTASPLRQSGKNRYFRIQVTATTDPDPDFPQNAGQRGINLQTAIYLRFPTPLANSFTTSTNQS